MTPDEVLDWLILHGPDLPEAAGAPAGDGPAVARLVEARRHDLRGRFCVLCGQMPAATVYLTKATELFTARRWLDLCDRCSMDVYMFARLVDLGTITDADVVDRWNQLTEGR